MENNIRKTRPRHLRAAVLILAALSACTGPVRSDAAGDPGFCSVIHGTLGEKDQPAPEISTAQLDSILASEENEATFLIDARPFEEFAMSHIPGAHNVSAKPGLPLSQFTSDVAEIDKLTHGKKGALLVLYCNGPFCGKSKRLAADLVQAGYAHVLRYQLGIPFWRALGRITEVEGDALLATIDKDRTSVVIDTREPAVFAKGSLRGARNIHAGEVAKAKDDGRLPMLDHNTRIFVVGKNTMEAGPVAYEIARNAFHNVALYAGTADSLMRSR